MPPRAIKPVGIALVDKPAGPSSFALVGRPAAADRRTHRTHRHARPVRDRPSRAHVGRGDTARTVLRRAGQALRDGRRPHGDDDDRRSGGRGRRAARAALRGRARGATRRPPRRGRAADPGRLGGEDRRRARVQARAAGHRGRDAAAALAGLRARRPRATTERSSRSSCTSSSGTYVRSIAEALGGHCRTLRRTAVGPFTVEEADPERLLPVAEALARLPPRPSPACPRPSGGACWRSRWRSCRAHAGAPVKVARAPGELERRPRAVAIGTFDGVHVGHRSVVRAAVEAGPLPTVVTFHPHPREVLGNQVALLATLERRLELLADAGVEETLVVEFTPEVAALEPGGVRALVPGRDRRGARRRRRDVPLRPRAAAAISPAARAARVSDARGPARRGRLLDADPAARRRRRRARRGAAARPPGRGRGNGRLGRGARRHARLPDRQPPHRPDAARPGYGIYAGAALDHRAAVSIGVNPHYGGAERRVEVFLLDFEGDLYGAAARRRAVGAPARRGGVRERDRARRPDRPRRRRDPCRDTTDLARRPLGCPGSHQAYGGWRMRAYRQLPGQRSGLAERERGSSADALPSPHNPSEEGTWITQPP